MVLHAAGSRLRRVPEASRVCAVKKLMNSLFRKAASMTRLALLLCLLVVFSGAWAVAQDSAGPLTSATADTGTRLTESPPIPWYATLKRGLAEAERTGKPILFVSGNPSCAGVSGMWCPGKGKIDSTYLHRPEVIEASKAFVCIRLTAYEDESERVFMSKLVRGQVSNTAFAILAPDGTPAIRNTGTGKGPAGLYGDAAEMARGLQEIARRYPPKEAHGTPTLPVALNARVGMVVAAADNLPFALVLAADQQQQAQLEEKLAKSAWTSRIRGRFIYAAAASMEEIPEITGCKIAHGILLIEPDMFGVGGKVVAEIPADQTNAEIEQAMSNCLQNFVPIQKTRSELAAKGLQQGIFYETGIPVSGKGEAADRERYRQRLEQKAQTGTPASR